MIGAAFGAFGQGLAAGFLAQRRLGEVAGKGLLGMLQGGAGPKPLSPDAFAARAAPLDTMKPSVNIAPQVAAAGAPGVGGVVAQAPAAPSAARSEMSAMTQSLAPAPAAPTQAAVPAANDIGRSNEQQIGGQSAPPAPSAPPASQPSVPAAPATPAAAEAAAAPAGRGIPTPQSKPGDGLVWADRGPGERLLMVRRDALRPGEQSFNVTEGTIGAGRGLPSMDAAAGSTDAMAAPVTRVEVSPLEAPQPVPRPVRQGTMGGPLQRNGPTRGSRGASLATVNGGTGSDTLRGSSGGDAVVARGYQTGDPVATDLPPHARALLNAISGGESGGRYDIRYTPKGGVTFTGTEHPRIFEKGPHGRSSAAGRYQFTATTWDGLGGGPFTPEMQDRRAWQLAQQDYKARTGRNLDADLRAGGLTDGIMAKLTPTWQAFKGNRSRHAATYQESLARYSGGASEGRAMMADAGPAAEGEAPAEDDKQQAKETARQQQQAAQEQASGGGGASSPGGAAMTPAGVTVPEVAAIGGGTAQPVNMAAARTIAGRGLPPVRRAEKTNTWSALRAVLQREAA